MNQAEFKMTTDMIAATPKEITFNFSELKEWLEESLSLYDNIVVTEENKKEAKETRAKINKVAKAIDDQRIAVKKQYMKPYESFKIQCDQLKGICNEVAGKIDRQLKEMDERDKAERVNAIKQYFTENIGEMEPFLTFEQVYESKWGNKSVSIEQVMQEIGQKIRNCEEGIETIRNLRSEFETEMIRTFIQNHNIYDALETQRRLMEIKERTGKKEPPKPEVKKEAEPDDTEKKEPIRTIDFRVYITATQLQALKEFLLANGIKYGRVPKEG